MSRIGDVIGYRIGPCMFTFTVYVIPRIDSNPIEMFVTWAPAEIFVGGGGKPRKGPPKKTICGEKGPHKEKKGPTW